MNKFRLYTRATPDDGFSDYLKSRGLDGHPLMEEYYLTEKGYSLRPQYWDWKKLCAMLEDLAKQLDDPYFGIRSGLDYREDFVNLGPIIFLLASSINVQQFVDLAIRYAPLHTNGARVSYEKNVEAQEVAFVFTVNPLSGPHRQLIEHLFVLLTLMGHRFLDNFKVKHITFQHRSADNLKWYDEAFKAPIIFNADQNAVIIDIKYLDVKRHRYLNTPLKRALSFYLNRQLKKHPYIQNSVHGSVKELLPSLLGVKKSNMNFVADSFGVHPKKLQRLLKDEGVSYQEILDEVRQAQAIRYLEDTDMAINKVSRLLDYTSEISFNTAFKRWFGMSPSNYRRHKKLVSSYTCESIL